MTKHLFIIVCFLSAAFAPRNRDAVQTPGPEAINIQGKDTVQFLDWETLQKIDYQRRYVEAVKGNIEVPVFPPKIMALAGTVVEVEGYVIPADRTYTTVTLSANPYAACPFCSGNSGPASILTLELKNQDASFAIDDFKVFRGKLRLNSKNVDQLYYTIEDAVEVKQ